MRQLRLAATVLAVVALASCEGRMSSVANPTRATAGAVKVMAASSLTEAFIELASQFDKAYPGTKVELAFAASSSLVEQIKQGNPADVFASADEANMKKLTDAGLDGGPPRTFVKNRLQIVVPADNPAGVGGLRDLANPRVKVVLCAEAVPCGTYARQALAKQSLQVAPVSQEENVKGVVAKVSLGEADAGIVYATDVRAAGARVKGIDIPDDQNVVASYPVATVKGGANPAGGQAFVDYLLSDPAQSVLAKHGFGGFDSP